MRKLLIQRTVKCRVSIKLALQNHAPRKLVAAKDLRKRLYLGLSHQGGCGRCLFPCASIHHRARIHAQGYACFCFILVWRNQAIQQA